MTSIMSVQDLYDGWDRLARHKLPPATPVRRHKVEGWTYTARHPVTWNMIEPTFADLELAKRSREDFLRSTYWYRWLDMQWDAALAEDDARYHAFFEAAPLHMLPEGAWAESNRRRLLAETSPLDEAPAAEAEVIHAYATAVMDEQGLEEIHGWRGPLEAVLGATTAAAALRLAVNLARSVEDEEGSLAAMAALAHWQELNGGD